MNFRPIMGLKLPTPESPGWLPTLNRTGNTTIQPDRFSQQLVDFAATITEPLLDVGAAFGVTTHPALAKGCSVIACDIDARHLSILWDHTPEDHRARLRLVHARFPDELDFDDHTFGAILLCRVLAIFDGPMIERAIQKISRWLAPGGKLCVVSETPYLGNLPTFITLYETRQRSGHPWPGRIDDLRTLVPERAAVLPESVTLLDPGTLRRVVSATDLVIEELDWLSRPDFPTAIQLDGRECVGMIARKP